MKKIIKKLLFIAISTAVIVSGVLLIRAAGNRGNDPYIYMKFNQGYGTTAYDEQGNVNGTITNAQWKTEDECLEGACLYFDGSGDYVSISDFDLE